MRWNRTAGKSRLELGDETYENSTPDSRSDFPRTERKMTPPAIATEAAAREGGYEQEIRIDVRPPREPRAEALWC